MGGGAESKADGGGSGGDGNGNGNDDNNKNELGRGVIGSGASGIGASKVRKVDQLQGDFSPRVVVWDSTKRNGRPHILHVCVCVCVCVCVWRVACGVWQYYNPRVL
jgi:hypothetical protein